jgi:hypothetical protein
VKVVSEAVPFVDERQLALAQDSSFAGESTEIVDER